MIASEPVLLSKLLSPFSKVRQGEATTALLLTLNVFFLLAAYYVIKPVREGLILANEAGPEYKAYMSGAIAIALLLAVPAYARFADWLPRLKLVVGVSLFFALHLLLFYWVGDERQPSVALSLGFYVWVGIFNMMVVAQFWAFANDLYTEEQGKRLFPLVALGASVGATTGSKISELLIPALGVFPMLLVGAALLVICSGLFWAVERLERAGAGSPQPPEAGARPEKPHGAFQLVFEHRYLLALALFALVFSSVNTNGEYLLGKLTKAAATEALNQGKIAPGEEGKFIGGLYGQFFFYVNLLGVLLQAFVVSRVIRFVGLTRALFILPAIALGDMLFVALVPVLAVIRIGKIAENATDYSLNNTLRQMLWLVTSREQKYKAKQAVDTFFVRMGDVSSALLVWVLVSQLSFSIRAFALVNAVLVTAWIFVMILIAREHRRLEKQTEFGRVAPIRSHDA